MAKNTSTVTNIQQLDPKIAKEVYKLLENVKDVTKDYRRADVPEREVAGLTEAQKAAQDLLASQLGGGVGGYKQFMDQAGQYLGGTEFGIQESDISQFMNPYQAAIQKEIDTSFAKAQQEQAARQQGQGSYGGSRAALGQAALEGERMDAYAKAAADTYAQAIDAAAKSEALGLEQALKGAGIGELAQMLGGRDIEALYGMGEKERQLMQAELEAGRLNTLEEQKRPLESYGFLSDIIRGVPTSQSTATSETTQTADPSLMNQILGAGIGGLSIYGGLNKMGIV
jgi:hypothetical protein